MRYHGCVPDPTAGCQRMQQGDIPFGKSDAVPTVRAESPRSDHTAHSRVRKAIEKMLPSEQEASGSHRSTLVAILIELSEFTSSHLC
ncbi:hypothetical protein T09_9510 [Trichinella sp. T9]|nr:hypothetical protein T09_9510 [Trichinella sp. T9]